MSRQLPYHAESRKFAKELASGKSKFEAFRTITDWVQRNIQYDYIRAIKIPKKNGKPDLEGCWKKRMGICMDTAALTTGMLKAVGIDATLCYGHADKRYHAWVEAMIDGKKYRYDHEGKAWNYTTERSFKS